MGVTAHGQGVLPGVAHGLVPDVVVRPRGTLNHRREGGDVGNAEVIVGSLEALVGDVGNPIVGAVAVGQSSVVEDRHGGTPLHAQPAGLRQKPGGSGPVTYLTGTHSRAARILAAFPAQRFHSQRGERGSPCLSVR